MPRAHKFMQMNDMPLLAESYLEFNAQDLEFGFNETRRDRILRTFVRNAYYYHLNEIYSTLKNEYTDWDKPVQNPLSVRDATLEVSFHLSYSRIWRSLLYFLFSSFWYLRHFKVTILIIYTKSLFCIIFFRKLHKLNFYIDTSYIHYKTLKLFL